MSSVLATTRKEFVTLTIMFLALIAAWAVVPEFRWLVSHMLWSENLKLPAPPLPSPAEKPSPKEAVKPPAPAKVFIGGTWKYDLTGKRCLIEQEGEQLKFYIDDPEQGQVQIGSGTIIQDRVKATILVRIKQRRISLDLRLSGNGEKLEGEYVGVNAVERAPISLSKLP